MIAPTDHRMINDLIPANQLSDFTTSQEFQARHTATEAHALKANEDLVQQLLGKVHSMYEQQNQFQL